MYILTIANTITLLILIITLVSRRKTWKKEIDNIYHELNDKVAEYQFIRAIRHTEELIKRLAELRAFLDIEYKTIPGKPPVPEQRVLVKIRKKKKKK